MAIKDHLLDIDFRTKELRKKQMIPDFIAWYEDLQLHLSEKYDDNVQSQLNILSDVLWYLLPDKDYKNLTRRR